MMRSEADPYLEPEAREPLPQRRWYILDAEEIAELRVRVEMARQLPRYQRGAAIRRIAEHFSISQRAVYRYHRSKTYEVVVEGWSAPFAVRDSHVPTRVGPWRRV